MQRWQWTRYQLKLYVGATVCMQREQLRHSSLCRFEAGYLLFSFLSASEDFSADMDSSQPVNSTHNTCSKERRTRLGLTTPKHAGLLLPPDNEAHGLATGCIHLGQECTVQAFPSLKKKKSHLGEAD